MELTVSLTAPDNRFTLLPMRILLFCGMVAVGALLAVSASAARRPVLQFARTAELPASGLKIKTMSEAVEVLPPPPATYRYAFTQGETRWSENLFAPVDLWRESQQAGQWQDRYGTRLTVAVVSAPCPGGFRRPHVSPEEYKAAVQAGADWTTNSLAQWVGEFCGAGPVSLQAVRHSAKFKQIYRCGLEGGAGRRLACLVQFRPSSPWFFVMFDLAEGLPMEQAEEVVQGDFIESMLYLGRPSGSRMAAARIAPPPGQPRHDAEAPVARSRTRTREQVASSIRNMKSWWSVETRHYIILSNMKQGGQTLVNHLQGNMEYLWAGFAQLAPSPSPQDFVGVIRVFATPEEYVAYVGPDYAWSSGLWSPARQELVVRPSEWGGTQAKADHLLRVIYHEAFHQYLFHACDGLEPSVWFNEGHASLFENGRIRGGRLDVEEDSRRLEVLLESMRRSPPDLGALLNLTHAQFYAGSDEDREQRYALAWALVYYLRKGAGLERSPYAHQICQRYLEALWQSKDAGRATQAAFDGIDLKRLTVDFTRFWLSNNKRSGADRNRILTGSR
jgi:hypothetical protein